MRSSLETLKDQFRELIPAISLVALEEFTRRSIESGANIAEMSQRTGIAVETLSALELVIRQNGATLEDFNAGIKFMNRNLSEAAINAASPAAAALRQLHLSASELLKLSTDQRFLAIADAISQFGTEADRTNLRMALLGRGAESLGNLMDKGSAGIKKAVDQAKALGLVLTREQVNILNDFTTSGSCSPSTRSGWPSPARHKHSGPSARRWAR
jgi:hypothetical protein